MAFALQQHIMESVMIFFGKLYLIAILGLKVRRIAVEKGILSVVLLNQALKILVLDDYVCQSTRTFPDK